MEEGILRVGIIPMLGREIFNNGSYPLVSGYQVPFLTTPPLSEDPIILPSCSPTSVRGIVLQKEIMALLEKGVVELAPRSPSFFSKIFVVMKASGTWRPILDLSVPNKSVVGCQFSVGDRQVSSLFYQVGRLDGINRSQERLLPNSASFRKSEMSEVRHGRGGLLVQSPR